MFLLITSLVSTIISLILSVYLCEAIKNALENIISILLNKLVSPVPQGPPWTFPNGQLIEKFVGGGNKSLEWTSHGSVYRIWALFTPEIVIATPQNVKTFYSDSKSHEKSRGSNAGWLFEQILGDAMGLVNGEKWRLLHNKFAPFFIRRAITSKTSMIKDEAARFIDGLTLEYPDLVFNPAIGVQYFAFLCTARFIYGDLQHSERERLKNLATERMKVFGNILQGGVYSFPFARWFKKDAVMQLRRFKDHWKEFNHHITQARKAAKINAPIVSLLGGAYNNTEFEQILQTLDEMLFANLDVTAYVLTGFIIFLAQAPEVREKIQEEIHANKEDLEQYSTRHETYLHHCFLETLRLRPITAFSMPESSPNAKVFGKFTIPPNTSVVVDTLRINYNPSFWGDDNDRFRPERFEHIRAEDLRYNFFTFGFSSRQCLGKFLAESSINMLIIELLLQFDWSIYEKTTSIGEMVTTAWHPLSNVKIQMTSMGVGHGKV